MRKIVCVGDIAKDLYLTQNQVFFGGISLNFCLNLSKIAGGSNLAKESNFAKESKIAFDSYFDISNMKIVSSIVSALGKEDKTEFLNKISKFNCDISHVYYLFGKSALQKINLIDGVKKFCGYDGGVLKKFHLSAEDIDFIKQHDVLAFPFSDDIEHLFYECMAIPNIIKVCDFSEDYREGCLPWDIIESCLSRLDIIFIGGSLKDKEKVKSLAEKSGKLMILTMGKYGSVAFFQDKVFSFEIKNIPIIDTTGCGDAFQAGFISEYLFSNNIHKSIDAGHRLAQKTAKNLGGAI